MDTFRSEVSSSSDALGSSRFGGSQASLFFSLSSARTTSTRSDLVSTFEQRFLERRANAKKKHEREKKRIESNQRAETAEDKRRVERDKARELRRHEMKHWLPSPETLQQLERTSRQCSRSRMREIRDWYPLPSSEDGVVKRSEFDEMLPVFADQSPLCKAGTRQRALEVAELERQALETGMRTRLAALKDKVAYLETSAAMDALSPTRTRAGRLKPLERPVDTVLGQSKETRSMSALPDRRPIDSHSSLRQSPSLEPRARTTTSSSSVAKRSKRRRPVFQSASSNDPQLEREAEDRDEAETRLFLAEHRRLARRHGAATTLQAAWRGFLRRRAFLRWSRRRWARRFDVLSVWVMMRRVGKMAQRALQRSCLCRWRREVALLLRLRALELSLFADAEKQPVSAALPMLVVNLALASDEWASGGDNSSNDDSEDEDRATASAAAPATTSAVVLGGLVNAAFAAVQQAAALDGASQARLSRVRHAEAKANVRRKIAQRVFLAWKRAHASHRRVALDAQLCLKRAARLFMASATPAAASGVWPREKLLAVFDMWARYAAFSRCRRSGAPLPEFPQPSAQWAVWLHNFQERQVRKVKAVARASVARQRRVLTRFRTFARSQRGKRERVEAAERHASATLRRSVLIEWRAAIADQAADKKCCRRAMEALNTYAALKRRLRPLKQLVATRATKYGTTRAWRAWGGVHLRAVCKRAWNVARIVHLPEWRRRATRTLLVWRWKPVQAIKNRVDTIESQQGEEGREPGVRVEGGDAVNVVVAVAKLANDSPSSFAEGCGRDMLAWRVLTAWRQSTRKRELFQSLRFHCARVRRKRLLFAVLNAWKQQVWKLADDDGDDDSAMKHVAFLEDRLAVDPWDAYRELSPMLPMLFFGYYSDAAAIFGGVVSVSDNNSNQARTSSKSVDTPTQRVYSTLEVQQFHRVLAGESLAEVRNAVLRAKHLVNATDPATGDSALHVALQGEGRARRLEVLVLLLTEGAATHDRPNRHGLTPRQLAASDSDAHRLLHDGVYAYFKATTANQKLEADSDGDQVNNVVLWRVVALMMGELRREARTRADVRHDVWYSQLKEENWLRQGCLRFPANSLFLPSVLRCRAFIDGMRKRVCHPLKRALGVEEALAPLNPAIDAQYGELGPYARFLLAPLFEHEAAETALIHSFVGVLFSLELPLQEAMDEAFRLENMCSTIESELSATWEQLQSSERQLGTALIAASGQMAGVESAIPLLRHFKDRSGMEYAMKRELLMSIYESRRQQFALPHDQGSADELQTLPGRPKSLEMAMELRDAEGLKASAQRKMRKLVKKLKVLEDQLPVLEAGFRESLVVDGRSVAGVSAARTKLERARLAKTSLLVKQADLQLLLSILDEAIASIKSVQAPSSDAPASIEPGTELAGSVSPASESLSVIKRRLEQEMEALTRVFDAVSADSTGSDDEEGAAESGPSPATSSSAASASTDLGPKEVAAAQLATIPSLQRRLETLLRDLFIANLFRTCCCWLAENMALTAPNAEQEQQEDDGVGQDIPAMVSTATLSTAPSAVLTACNEPEHAVLERAARRRRTSLTNTRRVLETFQRDGTSVDMMDRDVDRMKDSYADSASLLFKAERTAIVDAAVEQRRTQERIQSTQIITNPTTGEPEEAPSHIVDPAASIDASSTHDIKPTVAVRRNRKKEELRNAMTQRQLDRLAVKVRRRSSVNASHRGDAKGDASGDSADESDALVLPAVHGDALPLGNFILRSLNDEATVSDDINNSTPSWVEDGDCAPSSARYVTEPALVEAMWKRGARGDATTAKNVSESTSRGSLSVEKISSSTPQPPTPSPGKRVLSASRRTPEPDPVMQRIRTRRSSVHGVGAFSTADKVDGASLLQTTRCQSERDVSQAGDAECDENSRQQEGSALYEAELEGLSETEATVAADAEATGREHTHDGTRAQELPSKKGPSDPSGCLTSVMIPDDDDRDGEADAQADRLSEKAADNETTLVDPHERAWDSTTIHAREQSTLPAAVAGDDADELDAFLALMRSQPLSGNLSRPSSLIPTADEASARLPSSAEALADPLPPQPSCGPPTIFWESQSDESATRLNHSMVVQRLPISVTSSTRHMIDYGYPSETPPAIGRAVQRAFGSSERDAPGAVQWEADERDQGSSLSLQGKSLRMEGRRSRAELRVQRPHRDASDTGTVSTAAMMQAVTIGVDDSIPIGTADDYKHGSIAPAIVITVVAKEVDATPSDMESTGTIGSAVLCSEDTFTKERAAKCGPSFVMDSDGSGPTADQTSAMEIAGINSRVTSLDPSRAKPSRGKPTSSTRPAATGKAKGAATKKEKMGRGRTNRTGPQPSASCGDLLLAGANIHTNPRPSDEKPPEEPVPLTKLQKEGVWREFAVAPLSDAMQNAYAELYPQTYSRVATASLDPSPTSTTSSTSVSTAQPPARLPVSRSAAQLSVLPTPLPRKNPNPTAAFELDKKFWRAVEGYHAIGNSAIIQMDAATVERRRRDKAESIYASFIAGDTERDQSVPGQQQLDWVSMYPDQVAAIRQRLRKAPVDLFDALQQTAQLRISTALASTGAVIE